jgi:hypothetical protein
MSTDSHPQKTSKAQGGTQFADPPEGHSNAGPPNRPFLLHFAAAAMALVGAGLIQLHWPELHSRIPQDSWWPADAGVLVAATAYLLAIAAVHVYAALWPAEDPPQRRLLLGREMISALIVGLYFAIILAQGPTSTLMRAGLWRVPPLLLLAATVSLLVLAAALWSTHQTPRQTSAPTGSTGSRLSVVPTILVVGLLLALAVLNRHQPESRPSAPARPAQQP